MPCLQRSAIYAFVSRLRWLVPRFLKLRKRSTRLMFASCAISAVTQRARKSECSQGLREAERVVGAFAGTVPAEAPGLEQASHPWEAARVPVAGQRWRRTRNSHALTHTDYNKNPIHPLHLRFTSPSFRPIDGRRATKNCSHDATFRAIYIICFDILSWLYLIGFNGWPLGPPAVESHALSWLFSRLASGGPSNMGVLALPSCDALARLAGAMLVLQASSASGLQATRPMIAILDFEQLALLPSVPVLPPMTRPSNSWHLGPSCSGVLPSPGILTLPTTMP